MRVSFVIEEDERIKSDLVKGRYFRVGDHRSFWTDVSLQHTSYSQKQWSCKKYLGDSKGVRDSAEALGKACSLDIHVLLFYKIKNYLTRLLNKESP